MTEQDFAALSALELTSAHLSALKQRAEANKRIKALEALMTDRKPKLNDEVLILTEGKHHMLTGKVIFLSKSKAMLDIGRNYTINVRFSDLQRVSQGESAPTPETIVEKLEKTTAALGSVPSEMFAPVIETGFPRSNKKRK